MNPIIQHLQDKFQFQQLLVSPPAAPLQLTFSVQSLSRDDWNKVVSSHIILNMEYSLLGQQLRANLLTNKATKEQVTEELVAAIFLADLLTHLYENYLIVPREVKNLRAQRKIYRSILEEIHGSLPAHWTEKNTLQEPRTPSKEDKKTKFDFFKEYVIKLLAFKVEPSQRVRDKTVDFNLYRLLFLRSKRALDLLSRLDQSAYWYRHLIGYLDKYTDPLLPHIAWFFYLPRLSVNLFLLIKHTVPGWWMGDKEKSLDWDKRLQGQLLRRWFELGNDSVWVAVGLINYFILTGALAPFAVYLSIAAFGYDVVLAAGRAFVELNRLYELRKQYQAMSADPKINSQELKHLLEKLDGQINFEWLRLGTHVSMTTAVFLAACCAAPLFALNPVIPLIGAFTLLLLCFANFALREVINIHRPANMVALPDGKVSNLGFFAQRPKSACLPSPESSFKAEKTIMDEEIIHSCSL